MSTDMTLQEMTNGQIDKVVGNYRAMLVKHRGRFPVDAVQAVIGNPIFAKEQFNLFCKQVEARSEIITRTFTVDLSLVGMAAINATGRTKYIKDYILATMPRAIISVGKIHFFPNAPRYYASPEEVGDEYVKRELVPVDPHTLCAFNAAHPEFADTHPNMTQWGDQGGNFYHAFFSRWNSSRGLNIFKAGPGWIHDAWFAAVDK